MSEREKPSTPGDRERPGDDVGRLIEAAGSRLEVPAADMAAIKTVFRQAWEDEMATIEQPAARRWRAPLALAASLVVAVGLLWWWLGGPLSGTGLGVVAQIARIDGSVVLEIPGGERSLPLTASDVPLEIVAGSLLATAETGAESIGRIALRLADGTSLRLDQGSRVRLVSGTNLELTAGAIYVDTDTAQDPHGIEIRTPIGVARDVGTRFEVRLIDRGEAMLIKVRDGAVDIEQGATTARVEGAEALTITSDGAMQRDAIALHGAPWDWILRVAPAIGLESPTLAAYLEWLAGETGWRVVFADSRTEETARDVRIHGGIGHLDPDQTPDVVIASLGLDYRLEDGVLTVLGGPGAR